MKTLHIVSADTAKLQRSFEELTKASLAKYEGDQWNLYYEGFSDAIKMFSDSVGSFDEVPSPHIPRIIGG
jgi:hypothetical protein